MISYGVDLGGRYTIVAKSNFFAADVVLTDEQQRQTENVIGFKGSQRFIGETAALQYRSNILNTTRGFSSPRTFNYRGQEIILQREQQIGAFLRKLVQSITDPIVVSYPDFCTQLELVELWRAIQISQVNVIAAIPENMALMAYINYCQKNVQTDNLVIVDFGHTKFTAFLLVQERVICEVFNRQGTQAMDELLARWIINEAKIQPDQKSYLKILDSCENVRKRLNANKSFQIDIENIVPGVDFNCNLSRQQFESIVDPVLQDISALCFDLFAQCQQHPFDVIVTIGGGSRIPCFQNCVATIFQGKQIQSTIHATEAICQGCAVAGNLIIQRKQIKQTEHYLNLYEPYPIYIGLLKQQLVLPQKNIREFLIQSGEQCVKFQHSLTLVPSQNIVLFYDPPPINNPSIIRSYVHVMAAQVSFYYDDFGIIQMQSQGQIIIPVQDQNKGLYEMIQMELEMEKLDNEIKLIHELKYQLETKYIEIKNQLSNQNYSIPQFEKVGYILEDAQRLLNSETATIEQLTQKITSIENEIKKFIKECNAILITAGAGMGVDSGLPDFRGNQGFWNAYRPFKNKFGFTECANPDFLQEHPYLFWGFYGHRLQMYRDVKPHEGFNILKELCKNKDYFIVTSNVDGQFQKANFDEDKIYEIHGSIHTNQCPCNKLFPAGPNLKIDLEKFEALDPLPRCECERILRPNILMFNDWDWVSRIYDEQEWRYNDFIERNREKKICIIELGAGKAVPSIRILGERLLNHLDNCIMIRINTNDSDGPKNKNFYSIAAGALAGLKQL